MTSGCISSACIDARAPVRASYVNLYKWPESDAEFVKSVARGGRLSDGAAMRRRWGAGPAVVDSYSCRQMYLRSYTFTRKESVPEMTRRCLGKVRERATDFPSFHQRRESSGRVGNGGGSRQKNGKTKRETKKKKEGSCATSVRKLKEVSCFALYSIFHHFLSCTTSVDVA